MKNNRGYLKMLVSRWPQVLFQWDFLIAGVAAFLIGTRGDFGSDWLYPRLIWIEVTVAAAILGFVLAGLSIMVSLMSSEFLVFLYHRGDEEGLHELALPFWFTSWLVIVTILAGVTSIAFFQSCGEGVQRGSVAFVSFLIVWCLFSVIPIVRYIIYFAELRVMHHHLGGHVGHPHNSVDSGSSESDDTPSEDD